ncbi:hypothetical protein [Ralstonia pseudosolanacearum]|nr:hypothetical protein [Ralstonia pseudosolanacearum]MDO3558665.1 hypothetical protein [Ralstonia pseudosolanacearum]
MTVTTIMAGLLLIMRRHDSDAEIMRRITAPSRRHASSSVLTLT